jgi:hypothetical protein
VKGSVLILLSTCVATGCLKRGYNSVESTNSVATSQVLSGSCKSIDRQSLQKEIDRFSGIKRNTIKNWFIHDISEYEKACVVLLSELKGEISGSGIDVVVFNPSTKKLITVKDFLGAKIPKTLRAEIGQGFVEGKDPGYFAEFTGDSLVDIYKVILSQFPKINAFSACVANNKKRTDGVETYIPKGKLDWDPTPNRTWSVYNAQFDVHVASRNEVDDVYSAQLDSDFNGHVNGTLPCAKPAISERGNVGPWSGFLDKVFLDGRWVSVKYNVAYPNVRVPFNQDAPKYNYEVEFTSGAAFSACYARLEKISQIKNKEVIKLGPPGMEEPVGAYILIAPPFDDVVAKIKAQPDCFKSIIKTT